MSVPRTTTPRTTVLYGAKDVRAETPDAPLSRGSKERGFITGNDFLMDGGVTAAYWFR